MVKDRSRMLEKISQVEEPLHQMKEDLLKYRKMMDQINKIPHKDKKMIHQIVHNEEKLHMTSFKSLEGEQMEEKLKCVVPNSREDGIRELPETVLLHILSYLPIKDLIRTSIVAKQWRNLWKSVPSLKFNISLCTRESNKQYSEKKLDFVDKVFKCRDSFALPEFHLSYSDTGKVGTSFPRRFKVWIEVVARLKPRLVDLYLRSPLRSLQLPTMEALEMLKLRVHNIGYETFNLKSLSGLHSLKILKLEGVDFCLGELSDLPILEELHLRYCHFVGDSALNISLLFESSAFSSSFQKKNVISRFLHHV